MLKFKASLRATSMVFALVLFEVVCGPAQAQVVNVAVNVTSNLFPVASTAYGIAYVGV